MPIWRGPTAAKQEQQSRSFNQLSRSRVAFARAVLAGLAGSIANSLAIRLLQNAGIPTGTAGLSKLVLVSGNRVLQAAECGFRVLEKLTAYGQGIFHTAMGVSMAIVFAMLFFWVLPGYPWVRGLLFSLLPWLMQSVVVDPYMGFGPFGSHLGWATPFVSFSLNALFGLVLGAIYRPRIDLQ